jgi:hypothetical protein
MVRTELRTGPLSIARWCAFGQVLIAVLAALLAFYIAIGVAQDSRDPGPPLFEGFTVSGAVIVGVIALLLGAMLVIAAWRLPRGSTAAWWAMLVVELVTIPALLIAHPGSLDDRPNLWIADALLTVGVLAALSTARISPSQRSGPAPERVEPMH